MGYEEILSRTVFSLNKNRKWHCDSCGFYLELERKHINFVKGMCFMENRETFSHGYCGKHSKKKKKCWYLEVITECHVCGSSEKHKERQSTDRPSELSDRIKYRQVYDGCMEKL